MTSSSLNTWQSAQLGVGVRSRSLNFPSPFLDYEKFYIPHTIKELFDFMAHGYISDSNIKPAIESLASYPITSLMYSMPKETNKETAEVYKEKWKTLLEDNLKVRAFNIIVGLDYYVYGNAFVSVYKPFNRYLECNSCTKQGRTSRYLITLKQTKWRWQNLKFQVFCVKCNSWQESCAKDEAKHNVLDEISLVRWTPYHISIKKNPITGKCKYFYDIPQDVRRLIVKGDPDYLMYVQGEILEAVQEKARGKGSLQIEFDKDLIFAMQRPMASMPSFGTLGWGLPTGTASLRDQSSKNIMRRAQAMVMHEHTIPFRIFSPSMLEQPSSMLSSTSWKKEVEVNYQKWINNPNHIMTSPVPLNVQQVGGDKGALTLFPELQITNTDIIKGYGVPREFVEGGLTYSGSSVSLRMLENLMMDYVSRSEELINWIISRIAEISDLLKVRATYQPFKMADDIQLKQLMFSARQAREISHDTFCRYFDLSAFDERKLMANEDVQTMLAQAEAQATSGVTLQKMQEYMMTLLPQSMGNYTNPLPPEQVDMMTQQVGAMDPDQAQQTMQQLGQQDPTTARNVQDKLDLSPAGAMQNMMQMMSTPVPMQGQAMQDMQANDPTRALLMKILMPQLVSSIQNPVRMTPMPEQKPSTSAKKNL